MIHPSIDSLLLKNYNRFELCIITGKRARQLIREAPTLTNCSSKNAVTIAINEFSENKFLYERLKHRVNKLEKIPVLRPRGSVSHGKII